VHIDVRDFVDPAEPIVVEVALLHDAVLHSDLAMQRRTQSLDDAALYLVDSTLRIDDKSAVDGAGYPIDSQSVVRK